MNLTAPQKNALHGLDMLLRLSNVRVTHATLRDKLWQHPDFPSLVSLSDTLDELKVDNVAAHLTAAQLPEIPLPALAYLRSEGGIFAPVRATAPDSVEWWHHRRGWQKDSLTEFSQKWDGVTLLMEPTQQSGEADYTKNRKKELVGKLRLPFIVLSLLIGLSAWAGTYAAPPANASLYYPLLLMELAGVLVSSLLVWYSLDADNPFLRNICQLNANTNCSAVLNTSAAKLFSWLTWAEVGLFYFSGSLLALVFFRANPQVLYPLFFGLSLAALPYTLWSVYYQWRRARQWCVLCLTVQSLLWLEFGVLLYFQRRLSWLQGFDNSAIGLLLTAFLLLPTLWVLLKPVWSKALRTEALQRSLQKIKFDPDYLDSLSQRAHTIAPIFTEMRVLTLGNFEAVDTLTIVTNPTCSQCAQAHLEIEALMTELEDVKCQVILAATNRPGDAGEFIAHYILSQSVDKALNALHDWYKTLRVENWLKKNSLGEITKEGVAQLDLHRQWCELSGVSTTPTIFFNGIEIPRYYTISELRQLLKFFKARVSQLS